ncbi:MAG: sialidase family protein, partial [Candidatus Thermoplasmatota archaeon]
MRRATIVLALIVITLAGCVTPPPSTPDHDAAQMPQGYSLDCAIARPNATWPETCVAFASPNESPSKTEVDAAANPRDPMNVVIASKDLDRKASPCVWAVAQVSKDGGASWRTSYVGGDLASRKPGDPLYGWTCITDPIMTFDADGVLYYSLQASRQGAITDAPIPGLPAPVPVGVPSGGNMYMARSNDGGLTWSKIIVLLPGDGAAVFHDFMRMAWNPKTKSVYTIWNQYTGTGPAATVLPVLVASRDGGESADAPVYPATRDFPSGIENRGMAVAKDGTVYIALDGGTQGLVQSSTDDGKTWSAPVSFAKFDPIPRMKGNNTYRSGTNMEIAVDNSGGARDGWLYATWGDIHDNQTDIHMAVSKDKGKTWSAPMHTAEGAHAVGDQWMPRPLVDARGTLHMVYFTKEF